MDMTAKLSNDRGLPSLELSISRDVKIKQRILTSKTIF